MVDMGVDVWLGVNCVVLQEMYGWHAAVLAASSSGECLSRLHIGESAEAWHRVKLQDA